MRHMRITVTERLDRLLEQRIGMGDRRQNPLCAQHPSQFERTVELGSQRHPANIVAGGEDRIVLLGARIAQVARILCAALVVGEIGAFEMQPGHVRPFRIERLRTAEHLERLEQVLVRAGQRRRKDRRGAVTRRHLRRTQIGFDRAVHEIVTAGTVRMNIYESGGDPIAAGIGNQSGIPLIVTFADSRDHTAVPLHIAPARCRGTDDPSVYNRLFHRSIFFPHRGGSNIPVCIPSTHNTIKRRNRESSANKPIERHPNGLPHRRRQAEKPRSKPAP